MKESHRMIQEELALLALGIVPDVPVTYLLDHLAHCSGCRRFFGEVHETAGELAAALPLRTPPQSAKNKLFESLASLPAEAAGEGRDGRAPVLAGVSRLKSGGRTRARRHEAPERRGAGNDGARAGEAKARVGGERALWPREAVKWTGVAAMAAAVLLGGWAMELGQRVKLLEREVEAWASRYEADFRWLRSAESLLVHEAGPKLTARLAPPGPVEDAAQPGSEEARGGNRAPWGKAAAYDTYEDRMYLLVALEGLEAGASYEIWLAAGEASTTIGTVTAQGQGAALLVYPGERKEEWTAISVRRDGQVVLTGALAPAGGGGR